MVQVMGTYDPRAPGAGICPNCAGTGKVYDASGRQVAECHCPKASEWICSYRFEFADGGEPEFGLLCRGSEENCRLTMELVPAVMYNGPRVATGCRVGVFELTNVSSPGAAPGSSVSGTGLPER